MVATVPLAAAHALAPDLPLVAVDVLGDLPQALPALAQRGSALATMAAGFLMLVTTQTRLAMEACPPVAMIRPDVGHIGTGGFTRADELIGAGREAAETALPAITRALGCPG
jgi:predicted acylesterase/phospholipase RssA